MGIKPWIGSPRRLRTWGYHHKGLCGDTAPNCADAFRLGGAFGDSAIDLSFMFSSYLARFINAWVLLAGSLGRTWAVLRGSW